MRILQLAPYFLPYPGGQERYIHLLSRHLVQQGHEVHIVTADFPLRPGVEEIDGITVERLPCLARPLRNPLVPGMFLLGGQIGKYDLIHAHNEHSTAALAALYLKRRYGIPLVLTNHGQLRFGSRWRDLLERGYNRSLGRLILRSCDGIVVNSAEDIPYLTSLDPTLMSRITLLHNAVEAEERPSEDRYGLTKGRKNIFTILFVGRLIRRKGLEWLIQAASLVRRDDGEKSIRYILVGEGEDRRYLEGLVAREKLQEEIEFRGQVSDEELHRLYQQADLFVLPSLSETCPTVVLEAMYAGLPVITTDIPGIRDHFSGTAVLVPPRNDQALARAISALSADGTQLQEMSLRGRELVEKKYTWDIVSKQYEALYRRVIASR
jgi:glycosyltransferase involved in cell wall biosynthesis